MFNNKHYLSRGVDDRNERISIQAFDSQPLYMLKMKCRHERRHKIYLKCKKQHTAERFSYYPRKQSSWRIA